MELFSDVVDFCKELNSLNAACPMTKQACCNDGVKSHAQEEQLASQMKKMKALKSHSRLDDRTVLSISQILLDTFYAEEMPVRVMKVFSKILLLFENDLWGGDRFIKVLHEKISVLSSKGWSGISLHRLSFILEISVLTRQCLTTHFATFIQSLSSVTSKLLVTGQSNVGPDFHERVQTATRVCLQTLRFFAASYQLYLWQADDDKGNILSCLRDILTFVMSVACSDAYQMDSRLLSGTAIVMALNSCNDTPVSVETFHHVMDSLCNSGQNSTIQFGNVEILLETPLSHSMEICSLSDKTASYTKEVSLSRLVLLNGMVVSCCKDVLVYIDCGSPVVGQIFDMIFGLPSTSSLYHWLTVLESWLKCVSSICGRLEEPLLTKHRLDSIMSVLWTNWDSPVSGITELVSDLFKTMLQVYQIESTAHNMTSTSFYEEVTGKLLSVPWSVKGKYVLLCSVVSYVTVQWILQNHPYIPDKVIGCMSTNHMAPWASELYREMLSHGDFSSWKTHWVAALTTGLFSTDKLMCFKCSEILLPITFRVLPDAATLMVSDMEHSLRRNDNDDDSYLCGKERTQRLHAWTAVVKAARSFHLVADLPSDLLQEALCHADDNIRSDALTAICCTVKKSEPVTPSELDLVKTFLGYNMKVDSPPFRQRLLFNLKSLLVRLRDSSLSALRSARDKESVPDLVQSAFDFCDYILELCAHSMFPGACYQRLKTTLCLLAVLYETFLNVSHDGRRKGQIPPSTAKLVALAHIHGHLDMLSDRVCQLLLYCTLETTNEIREQASSLLMTYFQWPLSLKGMSPDICASQILTQAVGMCNSPKTLECESGALLCQMIFEKCLIPGLCTVTVTLSTNEVTVSSSVEFMRWLIHQLESTLDVCTKDPLEAASHNPGHGIILAFRRCLCDTTAWTNEKEGEEWRDIVQKLVVLADSLIHSSLRVLGGNNSEQDTAPSFAEMGVAIQDLTNESCQFEEGVELSANEQLIMAWCWLTIKECSLFIGKLVEVLPLDTSNQNRFLTHDYLKRISDLFISVLTRCRHRGAIESCSLGFLKFCTKLLGSTELSLRELPKSILEQVLSVLDTAATTYSVTRRSAGLPLIVECLLVSENRNKQSVLLSRTMAKLLSTASSPLPKSIDEKLDLPQVHSLNILKELFRNSTISTSVLPYVGQAVILSVDGFASHIWAVRNSAMMLFGSLVSRMLGYKGQNSEGSENIITAGQFFGYHPELRSFMLRQVHEASQTQHQGSLVLHPKLFPVLTILSKLGLGVEGEEERILEEFKPSVEVLLGNSIYAIRCLAASSLLAITTERDHVPYAEYTLSRIPESRGECGSFNVIHGRLLLVEKLFAAMSRSSPAGYHAVGKSLLRKQWLLSNQNPCLLVKSKYLDLITTHCTDVSLEIGVTTNAVGAGSAIFANSVVQFSLKSSADPINDALETLRKPDGHLDQQIACIQYLSQSLGGSANWTEVQTSLWNFLHQSRCYEPRKAAMELMISIYFKHGCRPSAAVEKQTCLNMLQEIGRGSTLSALCIPLVAILLSRKLELGDLCCAEVDQWCCSVRSAAEPTNCETLRYNCAVGLQVMGQHLILGHVVTTEILYSIFATSLVLLEDENTEVRDEATVFVAASPRMQHHTQAASIQTSLAQRVLIDTLVFHGNLPNVFPLASKLVYNFSPAWKTLEESIADRSLALFEQEDINIYAERALVLIKIASTLKVRLSENNEKLDSSAMKQWLSNEQQKVAEDLLRCLDVCQRHTGALFSLTSSSKNYTAVLGLLLYTDLIALASKRFGVDCQSDLERLSSEILKLENVHSGIQWALKK